MTDLECQSDASVSGRVTSAARKEAAIKEKRGQLFSTCISGSEWLSKFKHSAAEMTNQCRVITDPATCLISKHHAVAVVKLTK